MSENPIHIVIHMRPFGFRVFDNEAESIAFVESFGEGDSCSYTDVDSVVFVGRRKVPKAGDFRAETSA